MTDLRRTARATGLWYLGLAVTGGLGFLLIRPKLYDAADPAATLQNLVDNEGLARWGVALELGIVLTQALAAIWFYRLFRGVDTFLAGSIAAFGLVNATAILVSAGLLQAAVQVSVGDVGVADQATTVQAAYAVSDGVWLAGSVFFGLWLVPMGVLVLRSGWMPSALGWVLVVGGVGYVLSAFVAPLFAGSGTLVDLLAIPASVGEFWMIGYLLIVGVRQRALLGAE